VNVAREGGAPRRGRLGCHAQSSRRGRYQLTVPTLRISYDAGSEESHVLIADPADPKTAIWLDGVGYARRKR
jgi:hypothetical protein